MRLRLLIYIAFFFKRLATWEVILKKEELQNNTNISSYRTLNNWMYDNEIKGALINCIFIDALGPTKVGPEGALKIDLDVQGLNKIKIMVHNKGQMYIPNYFNLFGSDMSIVDVVRDDKKRLLVSPWRLLGIITS